MRLILALGFAALALAPAEVLAQSQKRPKAELVKLSAVSGQEIMVRRGISLERDCTPLRPIRVAIIKAPANGTIVEREFETFPSYDKENSRFACNQKRVPAMGAFYKPNDGFRGTDRFTIAIVYHDGDSNVYDVEMTVWR